MKTLRNLQQMVDVADPSELRQAPTPKAIPSMPNPPLAWTI